MRILVEVKSQERQQSKLFLNCIVASPTSYEAMAVESWWRRGRSSRLSNVWWIQLVAISLCIIRSSFSQSFTDTLVHANYTNQILFPTDKGYRDSVVLANYKCKSTCPSVVVQPETVSSIFFTMLLFISSYCFTSKQSPTSKIEPNVHATNRSFLFTGC